MLGHADMRFSRIALLRVHAGEIDDKVKSQVITSLRTNFRPEFLNRVDEIVMFKPLTHEEIAQIVDLLIGDISRRLKDRNISLELTEKARDQVVKQGYDPVYGARPLKRLIQHEIENPLAKRIVEGAFGPGDEITVDVDGDAFSFDKSAVAAVAAG